jgi:hypothetical protein
MIVPSDAVRVLVATRPSTFARAWMAAPRWCATGQITA